MNAILLSSEQIVYIPNSVLLDPSVSATALRIYAVLVHHSRWSSSCFLPEAEIAADARISVRTLRQCVRNLVDSGHIETGKEDGQNWYNRTEAFCG